MTNDGPGIAADDLPHIFDRFYQGRGGSTGIGPALVRKYVHLHGGTVCATSEDGATVLAIRLPL